MNIQFIHYVMLVCAALAAGLPSLASALPASASTYIHGATAVLVLMTGVLGAISPSASSKGGDQ